MFSQQSVLYTMYAQKYLLWARHSDHACTLSTQLKLKDCPKLEATLRYSKYQAGQGYIEDLVDKLIINEF